jgi:hypothetical protein
MAGLLMLTAILANENHTAECIQELGRVRTRKTESEALCFFWKSLFFGAKFRVNIIYYFLYTGENLFVFSFSRKLLCKFH